MSWFTKLSFIVKYIFVPILVFIILKHTKYIVQKNSVDICVLGDGYCRVKALTLTLKLSPNTKILTLNL